jgi:signal transduction histidine kinase
MHLLEQIPRTVPREAACASALLVLPQRRQARKEEGNEEETTLSFAILPYFWQTGIFYLGVPCSALALGSGAHWRRLTVQRRHQELKHQEALTMEKARIAADMHDELGSTLTKIVILGDLGGQFSLKSAPGQGSIIEIKVPLK